MGYTVLPPALKDYANENAEDFLQLLKDSDINYIDLREEIKFDSIPALISQIKKDIKTLKPAFPTIKPHHNSCPQTGGKHLVSRRIFLHHTLSRSDTTVRSGHAMCVYTKRRVTESTSGTTTRLINRTATQTNP